MDKPRAEQRVKLSEFYFEHQCSIVLTHRAYTQHCNERNHLAKPAILALIEQDPPQTRRLCSAPPKEIIEQVWQSTYEEQGTSTQQRSQELGITPSTLWRVQRDIQMFSYKFQLVQEL